LKKDQSWDLSYGKILYKESPVKMRLRLFLTDSMIGPFSSPKETK